MVSPVGHFVPEAEHHTKRHVKDAEDERELHFVGVEEADFVSRRLPNRVNTKSIRMPY